MSSQFPFVTSSEFTGASKRRALEQDWAVPESEQVPQLLDAVALDADDRKKVEEDAVALVERVRRRSEHQGAMEAFMREYDLSTEEGVVLMCLAEALLRIPDNETAEKLIADKLSEADWESHLGKSESLFVNASTWGLMLTGRMVRVGRSARRDFTSVLARLANRSGEPVVRLAIRQAMRIMGHQYVMGRDIESAMSRARRKENRRYRYSFDMLGEAALTARDAERYRQAYADAIDALGAEAGDHDVFDAPSISVKLSALHPRYEHAQRERVLEEVVPILLDLAVRARERGIALTVDAEEAARLMLQLDVFAAVLRDEKLVGWDGFGLALQSYLRRGWAAIDWLTDLARRAADRTEDLVFNFTSGDAVPYSRWLAGERPVVRGNDVTWATPAEPAADTLRLGLAACRDVGPAELRTATCFVKSGHFKPDYYAVETDATVIFPWDRQVVADSGELVENPDLLATIARDKAERSHLELPDRRERRDPAADSAFWRAAFPHAGGGNLPATRWYVSGPSRNQGYSG